ncbi:hypothetical protein I79_002872 [Cricetulus griseus]|uniref:Uncharacterized protein n=1 Tax=Cricetulus griseus TaxID=10029 RepID=G3GYJ3_CRIGR|nr:hypothetical protein I79_002872 [Cricetulus griseus]
MVPLHLVLGWQPWVLSSFLCLAPSSSSRYLLLLTLLATLLEMSPDHLWNYISIPASSPSCSPPISPLKYPLISQIRVYQDSIVLILGACQQHKAEQVDFKLCL